MSERRTFRPDGNCNDKDLCISIGFCFEAAALLRDMVPENLPAEGVKELLSNRIATYSCPHKSAKEARKAAREVIEKRKT